MAAAESFVGDSNFVVAFGDSIIHGGEEPSLLQRMVASHDHHDAACTIGAWNVSPDQVSNYGILVPREQEAAEADCRLQDVIEKPAVEKGRSVVGDLDASIREPLHIKPVGAGCEGLYQL